MIKVKGVISVHLVSAHFYALLDLIKKSGLSAIHNYFLFYWLQWIGENGIEGAPGFDGLPGLIGIQGLPGLEGIPGLEGVSGVKGNY